MKDKSKKGNTNDQLQVTKTQAQEYLNGWKRALADYDNYKNESGKRAEQTRSYQTAEIFNKAIPIIELYQSALEHIPEDDKASGWAIGLTQIAKQWQALLKQYDIKPIECTNAIFNPAYHEAVEQRHEPKQKDEAVLKVIEQGYTIQDQVIRPAKVIVNIKK